MIPEATLLQRASRKCDQIERELRKHPDFQLYLLTRSKKDRARMERMLMEIPNFRLWRALTKSVGRRGMASTAADVLDALAPLGVEHIDMPVTPARVWTAINAEKRGNYDREIVAK
jgi:hypothetical protein